MKRREVKKSTDDSVEALLGPETEMGSSRQGSRVERRSCNVQQTKQRESESMFHC